MDSDPLPTSVPTSDGHILALHELRQRQVQVAFLHGRCRSWRERRRIWPAVLTAAVIVALLVAATCVLNAFHQQQLLSNSAGVPSSELFRGFQPATVAIHPNRPRVPLPHTITAITSS